MEPDDERFVDATPCACGSDQVMHDMYEDEDIYWCAHCGRQVFYEDDEDEESCPIPGVERDCS